MSFIGAVATPVRQVLAGWAKTVKYDCLVIGAGNFTVPSVFVSGGFKGKLLCCDVSMYTSILGAYLTDGDSGAREREDIPQQLAGLLDFSDPLSAAASVSLLYDLRDVWQVKNPWQQRVVDQARKSWPQMMDKTVENLEKFKAHLDGRIEYSAMCGMQFMREHGKNYAVLAFPPTYKAGYEWLERLLQASIEWQPPQYQMITDQTEELYKSIAEFAEWFVVLEKDLPMAFDILGPAKAVLPKNTRSRTWIITGSRDVAPVVLRKSPQSQDVGRIWPAEKPIPDNAAVELVQLSIGQTIRLNELFMASHIDYFTGGVSHSFGYRIDGRLFGKSDFVKSKPYGGGLPGGYPEVYLMSDLAVPTDAEPRLAKLVLMCLLSAEVKSVLDRDLVEDLYYAFTTAFSRHPVSMKYRGIFKLYSRKENAGRFLLNYYAPFTSDGLDTVVRRWRKKYKSK